MGNEALGGWGGGGLGWVGGGGGGGGGGGEGLHTCIRESMLFYNMLFS